MAGSRGGGVGPCSKAWLLCHAGGAESPPDTRVHALPVSRRAVDLRRDPGTMVALGDHEVVAGLQVHPEPGVGAEMVREAQRRVRADRACR